MLNFDKKKDTILHVVNIDGPLNYMENNWKFNDRKNGNFTESFFWYWLWN